MTRTSRSTLGLVFLVALGLLTASYAIWAQGTQIRANQRTITQQQQAVNRLLAQSEKDRAEQEQLRRLVQALQAQVRQLGGTPLLSAPTERTTPSATAAPAASPTRAAATRSPSPRPSASPRPTVSPRPTSSPSPVVCVGPICLPPGGTT